MGQETKNQIKLLGLSIFVLFLLFIFSSNSLFFVFSILSKIFHLHIQLGSYTNNPLFTLGDMLAGVGLLFTVYQLRGRSWETVFKIRKVAFITLISLMILAVLGTFSSLFFMGISEFLQILSAGILTSIPFFFLLVSSEKHLFKFGNKEIFYKEILSRISGGNEEDYVVAVDILMENFSAIIELLQDKNGVSTLFLLTDQKLAEYITTSRADFLKHLVFFLKKEQYNPVAREISRAIFGAGLNNINSYFYRELFSNERGLLQYCFGDFGFQNEIRIFNNFNFPVYETIEQEKIALFAASLEKSIKAYFDQPKEKQYFDNNYLEFVVENLTDVLRSVFWAEKIEGGDLSISGKKILNIIDSFHGAFTKIIKDNFSNQKMSANELAIKIDSRERFPYSRPESLTALYVEFSVRFLSVLGFHPNRSLIYIHGLQIMDQLFKLDSKFRTLFNELIWYQIYTNVKGYYPPILPVYMDVICFRGVGLTTSNIEKEEYNKLLKFMYTELKPKLEAGAKMANNSDSMESALMGASVSFNRENGKFIYTDSVLKKTILEVI